jgi:type VII secretion protein EccB
MASRRDQLQSYQFLNQRVISAFVMRETDPAQSPLRRGIGAVFGGLMIAIVVSAGFGVYGLLTKVGSDTWKADGSVVIEKETGASFVYFDGKLHPTLNYTSAMLAAGRPNPAVFRVANASLAAVPRGVMMGIAGAPDSLPGPNRLLGPPWTLCSVPGADSSGRPSTSVALVVSGAPTGGRRLGDEAILARDNGANVTYLVWHGHRHTIVQPNVVVPALFGAVVGTASAGPAWLNALPSGTGLGPITVNNRGNASPAVPGRKIGEVLVAGSGRYLVFDDGVAAITPLQEDILSAQYQVRPVTVAISEINSAKKSSRLNQSGEDVRPPQTVPTLVVPTAGDLLCAVTQDARATPEIRVGGTVAGLDTATPTVATSPAGARLADRILVPAGHIALIRVLASPTAESGAFYLVTDLGIRYAVSSVAALQMLGYQPQQAYDVPANLVSRIPAGPTLDPNVATKPVS